MSITERIALWFATTGATYADQEVRELLNDAADEIERLRSALLCEDCNGTGWMYCGVADTSTPCRNCAAYEIRKAA